MPTLKKSTYGTNAAAFSAADGTSIMMPIRNESGRPPTSAIAASTTCRAATTSETAATIGNITLTGWSRATAHIATS